VSWSEFFSLFKIEGEAIALLLDENLHFLLSISLLTVPKVLLFSP